MTRQLRPLTERILTRLPGPRAIWIAAWALVPWCNSAANLLLETGARSAVWEQSRTLVLLNYAALSFAIAISLWGPSGSRGAWNRSAPRPRMESRWTHAESFAS